MKLDKNPFCGICVPGRRPDQRAYMARLTVAICFAKAAKDAAIISRPTVSLNHALFPQKH